jgi:flavin-dependent dehydrogenase
VNGEGAARPPRVVIAGAGPAGAILACLLRRRGMGVWLVQRAHDRDDESFPSIEALPARAAAAFVREGLGAVLRRAGAVGGRGFETGVERAAASPSTGALVGAPGHAAVAPWVYVDRMKLARELRAEASALGARLVHAAHLPNLVASGAPEPGWIWTHAGLPSTSHFAVDASGRSARWIGPAVQRAPRVAHLYLGPGTDAQRAGRVVQTRGGWAYALAHPEASTVGVIEPGGRLPRMELDLSVAQALALETPEAYRFVRRVKAHAQWARTPVTAHLLAVGDAAFACDPIAGQGLRFALASASAAAVVLASMLDDAMAANLAREYYTEFVESARRRHLRHLAPDEGRVGPMPLRADDVLSLARPLDLVAVRRGQVLAREPALRTADGELVRWAGGVDLLILREAAVRPMTVTALTLSLGKAGIPPAEAASLLAWGVDRGVLCRPSGVASDSKEPASAKA